MASDNIHLFLNPTAGRGRAGRRQSRILELLGKAGRSIEIHRSQSIGDLEGQVSLQVNKGATRIIVAGGDGTVHEAINGILRSASDAALGVIPTGTGNDFAKGCDIPVNWEHATELLADRILANEAPRKIDAGKFNDRFFANGAGVGFDAKVTHIAQSIRLPLGAFVYLLAIFRAMFDSIATPRLKIVATDFEWDGPVTFAAISNGPWVGGMFHIAPKADNTDEAFELLVAKPVTRRRILALLPKLMNGEHLSEPDTVQQSVTTLEIQSEEAIPSHLDGEAQPLQKHFKIQVLPGALNLL